MYYPQPILAYRVTVTYHTVNRFVELHMHINFIQLLKFDNRCSFKKRYIYIYLDLKWLLK